MNPGCHTTTAGCLLSRSGEIVAANEALEDAPETVNQDPYGDGWMFRIKMSDPSEVEKMLSAEDYQALVDEEA